MRIQKLWLAIIILAISLLAFFTIRRITATRNTLRFENETTFEIQTQIPAAYYGAIAKYPGNKLITVIFQEEGLAQNIPLIRNNVFAKSYFLDYSFDEKNINIRLILNKSWLGHPDDLSVVLGNLVLTMLELSNTSPPGNSLNPDTRKQFTTITDSITNSPDYKPEEWQFITRLQ